jgi:hypothetical protein
MWQVSKKGFQNMEYLRDMYDDISNDESDHWNPMSENPIIPESQQDPINVENVDEEVEDEHMDMFHDWDYQEDESAEVNEVSPTNGNEKKKPRVVIQIPKKPKSSTRLLFKNKL